MKFQINFFLGCLYFHDFNKTIFYKKKAFLYNNILFEIFFNSAFRQLKVANFR
jgi:hypothetical protein